MTPDLIFHLVSRRNWKVNLNKGYYYAGEPAPASEGDSWIQCSTGAGIQEVANRKFKGRKRVFLLVINTHRLSSEVSFHDGDDSPSIRKRINLDAIIDKIDLMPNEEGLFEVQVDVE